jgi:hypothetical protein
MALGKCISVVCAIFLQLVTFVRYGGVVLFTNLLEQSFHIVQVKHYASKKELEAGLVGANSTNVS